MRFRALLFILLLPVALLAADDPATRLEALPKTIAGCESRGIKKAPKVEDGASVTYHLDGLVLSVFVYDRGQKEILAGLKDPRLKEEFESATWVIDQLAQNGTYKDLEFVDNGTARYGGTLDVLRARYKLTRTKGSDAGVRFVSDIYMWVAAGQFVKVRVSGTAEKSAANTKRVEEFIPAVANALSTPGRRK